MFQVVLGLFTNWVHSDRLQVCQNGLQSNSTLLYSYVKEKRHFIGQITIRPTAPLHKLFYHFLLVALCTACSLNIFVLSFMWVGYKQHRKTVLEIWSRYFFDVLTVCTIRLMYTKSFQFIYLAENNSNELFDFWNNYKHHKRIFKHYEVLWITENVYSVFFKSRFKAYMFASQAIQLRKGHLHAWSSKNNINRENMEKPYVSTQKTSRKSWLYHT